MTTPNEYTELVKDLRRDVSYVDSRSRAATAIETLAARNAELEKERDSALQQAAMLREALELIAKNSTPMSIDSQARRWMADRAKDALSSTPQPSQWVRKETADKEDEK